MITLFYQIQTVTWRILYGWYYITLVRFKFEITTKISNYKSMIDHVETFKYKLFHEGKTVSKWKLNALLNLTSTHTIATVVFYKKFIDKIHFFKTEFENRLQHFKSLKTIFFCLIYFYSLHGKNFSTHLDENNTRFIVIQI